MSADPLPHADGDEVSDPAHFTAKWRAAWPEWSIAEVFLPPMSRARVDAWQALQFELTEAAWGGADARPGEAKLAWWVDELQGWSQGRRRHPLGSVLQRSATGWGTLAQSLPALAATRERANSPENAVAMLMPAATALAGVERELFGADAATDLAPAVVACWLHARLARHPGDAVPLSVMAQGDEQAESRWCGELLARWPRADGASRYRCLALGLAAARLRRGSASRPLPAMRALLTGWGSARG